MHEVGTRYREATNVQKWSMEESYSFENGCEKGLPERQVVPLMGDASYKLPPFKASTGLLPSVPNPYLDQRDASYVYSNDDRQACKMAGAFPYPKMGDKIECDEFAPPGDSLYGLWPLGEADMQSLFLDLHENRYQAALEEAMAT